MQRARSLHALAPLVGALLVSAVTAPPARGDDQDLFTTSVPPNVMLVVDNSGSMNNIVWHPAFDPEVSPSCSYYNDGTTYNFDSTITMSRCGNTRTLYPDTGISGWTRILGSYLNWIFSDEADPYVADLAATDNGTRSMCLQNEGLPATYSKYRRSRITAAKEVLREVICNVNAAGDVRFGLAQFQDDSDPRGGYVVVPIDDYSSAQGTAIDDFVEDLAGEAWTPLAETLYYVYRYFQSRSSPAFGKDGTTTFPAYTLKTDGTGASYWSEVPDAPVENECQKSFVIIITDGEPTKDDFDYMDFTRFRDDLIGDYNPDNADPENGDETPSSCAYCDETSFYLDDIAKFMQENDFERDQDGTQTIDVYTIGFTTSGPANALLQKTATVGNGLFFQSNNAEELAPAIIDAVTDIIEKAQSFTSATVPSSRTAEGDNFYASVFVPKSDSGFWEGHLRNFGFTGSGDIVTANGYCATGEDATALPPCASSGRLRFFSNAFWDAADAIPAPSGRNLYVEFGNTPVFSVPTAWDEANLTAADLDLSVAGDAGDPPYDTLSSPTDADLVEALVNVVRGCEFGTDCTPRTNDAGDPRYLGDIFHSNPVVVGSPNARINESSYQEFATTHRDRPRVIYAGSNDGFLHGFMAGEWKTQETDGTPLSPPRHDRGTGEELFGFMPREVRTRIKQLPKVQSFPRVLDVVDGWGVGETVDGAPVAADVWLYRSVSGSSLGSTDPLLGIGAPLGSGAKQAAQWRTVLLSGLRDGGKSYFALDVSDPPISAATATTTYPRYLWGFPCERCTDPATLNPGTAGETSHMGFTWSEPVVTRVRVAVDGGTNPEGYERWVAIFGAGYHPHGDPNGSAYKQPADAGFTPQGRGIYMVDITTGEVLARKVFDAAAPALSDTDAPQEGIQEMRYALPSGPAVFDIDFDGFADVVYIGDLGGNVWKWVVTDVGDDPINNAVANMDPNQPDWPFRRFFRAQTSLSFPSLPLEQAGGLFDPSVHYQSFFFPPTAVLRDGKLILAFGAGERANPQGEDADYADGDDANNNHHYVVKDSDPLERNPTRPHPIGDSVDEGDLENLDAASPLSCSEMLATKQGYYITGRDAEKFVTNSVIFLGEVITTSFIPPDPTAASSVCEASGEAFLYRFDLDCGVGSFQSNPGSEADKRRVAIGGGIPTRPRVSVGGLQGGSGGGCANKVVVITSDGFIMNDCPGPLPTSGIQIRSWRQQ